MFQESRVKGYAEHWVASNKTGKTKIHFIPAGPGFETQLPAVTISSFHSPLHRSTRTAPAAVPRLWRGSRRSSGANLTATCPSTYASPGSPPYFPRISVGRHMQSTEGGWSSTLGGSHRHFHRRKPDAGPGPSCTRCARRRWRDEARNQRFARVE